MQDQAKLYEIREQIKVLLNYQYKTNLFKNYHSFPQMIRLCEKSLRDNILPILYQIPNTLIDKYQIKITNCPEDPFYSDERQLLAKLAEVCEHVIQDPGYKYIEIINGFLKSQRLKSLNLKGVYKRFQLNFRYVNIKQALIYTCLSQCNVWYTICKNRRKSKKQFDLDPLINYFQEFVARINLKNPFHLNILPKKQVKNIERKSNEEKSGNLLYDAVSNGNHDLAKSLLQKGAKIQLPSFLNNRQRTEVRCVHRACLNGDLKMCKILDSFGANWQSQDSEKMTPIFYAIQSSNIQVIKYLVQDLKVNIQKQETQSRTPFYWSCTVGDLKVIDYLYKAGCNINQKSELGRTALSKSCYLGRIDIVLYLLKCKQIDMFSKCRKGRTALHNAVFGPKGGRQGHKFGTNQKDSPQCAQILLQNGMEVDFPDEQSCTPLHVAASSAALDSIRMLLAYGASLKAKNNYQETPLMTAAKFGHVDVCQILHQQYKAEILCLDKFHKNLLLLAAKFQTNSQNGILNPAYSYFLQPFIQQCKKQGKIQQLHRTFHELASSQYANKMLTQTYLLWKGFKKYEIKSPILTMVEIEKILQISIECNTALAAHNQIHDNINTCYLEFAQDILSNITLSDEQIKQIHLWLIRTNQVKVLEFVHEHGLLSLSKLQISASEFFYLFENDELGLKQRVVSFCILSLNFDWISYRNQDKSNILHTLVRKQRSGCIVQLFKALSGKIPQKILTNRFLQNIKTEDQKIILAKLLTEKDESGLDAHQLSLVLKNKSLAKIIQDKLRQENRQFSSVLDIAQYQPVLQTDPLQLSIFNNFQHENEEKLSMFQQFISKIQPSFLEEWWNFRKQIQSELYFLKDQNSKNQTHQNFWKHIENKPMHYIKSNIQLKELERLQSVKVLGIDIEYFNYQGITIISLLQISSLSEDFIIDCLSVGLDSVKKFLKPIAYNEKIVKIMHGADNDLVLVKSLFNVSFINFVDTSRLDIQLRQKSDLRGLATLAKQYLGTNMSKQYQVSEWRIRPVPRAMLLYAKKDSSILPYLLVQMLGRLNSNQKIKQFILSGCKQVRRNKKASQPLLKGIKKL